MKLRTLASAAVLSSLSAACGGHSGGGASGTLPSGESFVLVSIRLEDAVISPEKADGTPWDALTPTDKSTERARVLSAMDHAASPSRAYEAAIAALANVDPTWDRPDVAGKASVDQAEGPRDEKSFKGPNDTFTPRFGTEWRRIPLTHWTTMHMYFVETDPNGTQDIGAIVLSAHDLAHALEHRGRVHHIRVDDQANGQILYVGIVVNRED